MINIWFKFEYKIQNTSKVFVFTRNHTDNDEADEDGTKNNMSPPVGGGGHNQCLIRQSDWLRLALLVFPVVDG